jgi:LCP family protein required for cell wall assembly
MPVKKGRPRWKKILISFAILLAVILLGVGGYLGYKFIRDFGWGNVASLFDTTRLKGENVGRVNILLAGDSSDDPGHNGADLTDSIMLISIDTNTHKAFMLSVPRDLYVNIPGFDYSKINATYEDGQGEKFSGAGYPAGGMGLLEEVVSQKLNVPIDYYALINYTAFRDLVNSVGGITVNIQSPDPRGLYDPNTDINLPNGPVNLNGQSALNLARARGDGYGSYGFPQADFDRTMHQRQMLIAVEQKATSISVLSNPIRVGDLFDAVSKNVTTDLKLNDARRLGTLLKPIPTSKIASASLNSATYNGQSNVNLLTSYITDDGEDALVPAAGLDNYTQIQAYVAQLEASN